MGVLGAARGPLYHKYTAPVINLQKQELANRVRAIREQYAPIKPQPVVIPIQPIPVQPVVDLLPAPKPLPQVMIGNRINLGSLKKIVATYFEVTEEEMISESREAAVLVPRMISMWLTYKYTNRSLPDVGRFHGGRDHTTALHAIRTIEERRFTRAKIAEALNDVRGLIGLDDPFYWGA
jgi:hypothetical protein